LHKEYGERSLPALLVVRGEAAESLRGELNAQRETNRIIINRFAPPGVLVDDALQILQFRGSIGTYLERLAEDELRRAQDGARMPDAAAARREQ
jgi:two-component system CheB/CheR fusion protein